jgi:hypothetical protein
MKHFSANSGRKYSRSVQHGFKKSSKTAVSFNTPFHHAKLQLPEIAVASLYSNNEKFYFTFKLTTASIAL